MKKTLLTCLSIALFSLSGCAISTRAPVTGFIYQGTEANEQVTSNTGAAKRGEACASSILGWVATGEASISAAAKAAGITKVAYVDSTHFGVLGIYAEYCAVVYGE
jgi:hypothetical protein